MNPWSRISSYDEVNDEWQKYLKLKYHIKKIIYCDLNMIKFHYWGFSLIFSIWKQVFYFDENKHYISMKTSLSGLIGSYIIINILKTGLIKRD